MSRVLLFTLILLVIMIPKDAESQIIGRFLPETNTFVPEDTALEVGEFWNGMAVVRRADRFGILNTQGDLIREIDQEVIPFPIAMEGGLFGTQRNPTNGLGILIVSEVLPEQSGTSMVFPSNGGTYVICDESGKVIFPHLLVWKDQIERYAMCLSGGKLLIRLYDHEKAIPDLGLQGECYGPMGILNPDGSVLLTPKCYQEVDYFKDGLARVQSLKTNKYGFINEDGEEVIRCKFEEAQPFYQGRAKIGKNEKDFFIDSAGKRIKF